jgi:CRISPR-associated protein Cas4
MPILGFMCPVENEIVSPKTCIAHAVDKGKDLPAMGCHFTPKLLREIAKQIVETESFDANTWRVTELIGCVRKARLQRTVQYALTPKQAFWMWRGSLIHAMLEDHHPDEVLLAEKRLFVKVGKITLTGKPDALLVGNHLADYKSTERLPREPRDHHIDQLNVYAWLLAQNGMTVQSAEIVYISMMEPRRLLVQLAKLADTQAYIEAQARRLTLKRLPVRVETWECGYCAVRIACEAQARRGGSK